MQVLERLVVGQFSESFPPLMDGVGFVVKNYSELLLNKKHQVYAIVSGSVAEEGYEYDRNHGIDYTIRSTMVPLPGISPYGIVVKNMEFRKEVREIEFDILHTHAPFFLGRFAEQLNRHKQIPLISTFHSLYKDDFYGFTHSHTMTEHLIRMILRHYNAADEVWTPTEWSKRKLYGYGFDGEIQVVENGCDLPVPTAQEYRTYAEEGHRIVGVPKQIPLLLYIGQLKKEKNLELLIEALAIAHAQHSQFHMVFVGSGPDTAYFKRTIDDLQLKSHVTFTGKITDREQIKALLAASSLFLFPSQYDTSALVLREAAAFSLPLLNTLGSSTAGVSTDNVNGFVAKNNAKDYGGRLVQLLGQPQLCKNVGLEANKTLYRNWSDVVDEVEQRYLELKAKGPKAKKKRSSSR